MARRSGKKGGRAASSGSGFPTWGIYALGGLAIAGIIYGLTKYGPTSEAISGWIDSATGYFGEEDADEFAESDFSEEDESTASDTRSGYGSSTL